MTGSCDGSESPRAAFTVEIRCIRCAGGPPCMACIAVWCNPKVQHVLALRRHTRAIIMGMKKPTAGKGKTGQAGSCPDAKLMKAYPTLVEYLVTVKWDDGSARERSTVTLFIEDGSVKLALNDRDLSRSLYVTADSLDEALGALEEALKDDSADWRAWKGRKK